MKLVKTVNTMAGWIHHASRRMVSPKPRRRSGSGAWAIFPIITSASPTETARPHNSKDPYRRGRGGRRGGAEEDFLEQRHGLDAVPKKQFSAPPPRPLPPPR